MKPRLWLCAAVACAIGAFAPPARAGIEPFLGELMLIGSNYCPQGFLPADGRTLPINVNQALFSLLGTTYGGDGEVNFALPDLRGRAAIGAGQGPGLSDRWLGEQGGVERVTLTQNEMPAHTHVAGATSSSGNTANPTNALPARKSRTQLYRATTPNTSMAAGAIGTTGGSQSHENMPPFLVMTWCIATSGIYPSHP